MKDRQVLTKDHLDHIMTKKLHYRLPLTRKIHGIIVDPIKKTNLADRIVHLMLQKMWIGMMTILLLMKYDAYRVAKLNRDYLLSIHLKR